MSIDDSQAYVIAGLIISNVVIVGWVHYMGWLQIKRERILASLVVDARRSQACSTTLLLDHLDITEDQALHQIKTIMASGRYPAASKWVKP